MIRESRCNEDVTPTYVSPSESSLTMCLLDDALRWVPTADCIQSADKQYCYSQKLSSCPVLSCPVLSCPVLSCPVLSCPVLVLSWSCPVFSFLSTDFGIGSFSVKVMGHSLDRIKFFGQLHSNGSLWTGNTYSRAEQKCLHFSTALQ
jgi:hypothetical protein